MYEVVTGQEIRKLDQWNKDRAVAQANLQIYTNAITAGNLSYAGMSGDQKLMISKLEAQSGLPVGFIGNLQMSPQDRLLSINDKTGEALMMGADGNFEVVQTGMRIAEGEGKKPSEAETHRYYLNLAKKDIEEGVGLKQVLDIYSEYGGLKADDLYKLYNVGSPHGTAYETADELGPWGVNPDLVTSSRSKRD